MSEKYTLKELQEKIQYLFIESDDDAKLYIIARYEKQRTRLIEFIEKYIPDKIRARKDLKSPNVPKEKIIKTVRDLYDKITNCVSKHLNGEFIESFNILEKPFFGRKKERINLLPTISIETGDYFFRVRNNETYMLYPEDEMFHIPFDKRGKVGNQRFSVSGYPCLYLGKHIYGCWEEAKRPNIDMFNIIALQATRPFKLINLAIPPITTESGINASLLCGMVLRLACSLKAENHKDFFKSEYIIPQLVLSHIVQRNKSSVKNEYIGIRYTSTVYKQSHDVFGRKELLLNYVIPIQKNNDTGLCQTLVDLFEVSEVTSLTNERVKKNAKATVMYDEDAFTNAYKNTEFGMLEGIMTAPNKEYNKIKS